MNQKGFANIILVIVIVILVGVVGYFALVRKSEPITQTSTPTSTQQPSQTQNIKPSVQSSNQPTTSAHTNYKKIISESFDYGSGEQQFGIIRVAGGSGPSSFSTDNRNYLYITDFRNHRVKIFDSSGNQVSMFNTEQPLFDIVVDKNGNIYGDDASYTQVFRYSSGGSLSGKIENPPAFSEIFSSPPNAYSRLYIVGDKLYITDAQQNSYLISSTEGNLKLESATKLDGIYGLSGKRYKTNYTGGGTVDIINQAGITEKTIALEINGLATIVFLGEDQNGNFYIYTETVVAKDNIKLQVRKYNPSGNLLTTLDIPNIDSGGFPTVKPLHVDRTGDIWQVEGGASKLFVNRWSTTY